MYHTFPTMWSRTGNWYAISSVGSTSSLVERSLGKEVSESEGLPPASLSAETCTCTCFFLSSFSHLVYTARHVSKGLYFKYIYRHLKLDQEQLFNVPAVHVPGGKV